MSISQSSLICKSEIDISVWIGRVLSILGITFILLLYMSFSYENERFDITNYGFWIGFIPLIFIVFTLLRLKYSDIIKSIELYEDRLLVRFYLKKDLWVRYDDILSTVDYTSSVCYYYTEDDYFTFDNYEFINYDLLKYTIIHKMQKCSSDESVVR